MAILALAGAGAGIGASIGGTFLGMSATSIGWMAGSFLGQLLFAEKTHTYGPRLKGDRFTGSALGQVRPIVWGTCKVEGKIIWQTPYHEHEHTEDSGGKGGGSEYTSYTYTRSFAILLCEGQIEAVRRVWINGKLEFDWSENSNVAADMQSGTKVGGVKFYYGSTTQEPDPTMESFDGVGNVPAYRGTAYMVFNEYDVTDTSGACPVVEVEVVANASLATASALGVQVADDINGWGTIGFVNEGVLYYQNEAGKEESTFNVIGVDLSNGNVVYKKVYPHIHSEVAAPPYGGAQRGPFCDDQLYWYFMGTNQNYPVAPFNESAAITYGIKLIDGSTSVYEVRTLFNTDGTNTKLAESGGWRTNATLEKFFFKRGVYQTYLYATSIDENTDLKRWVQRWDMPDNYASKRYDFADGSYILRCYPSDDGDVYVYNGNDHKIYRFDFDLNLIDSKALSGSIAAPSCMAYSDDILWLGDNLGGASGNATISAYQYSDMTLLGSVSDLSYGTTSRLGPRTFSMYASGSSCAVTIEGKLWTVGTNRVTRQSATLSDIVANLHQRAGQASDDYDVAALTDSVRGFLVTEQVSCRSCIESLQLGFLFDARDTGGKIQYVKRGGASLATLVADDLGAYESEPVSEWTLIRQQEEELPKTLTINYLDYNGSYEKSAQNATRQAVLAGDITTFQVPIVFTADEAQEVVSKHMYEAWEARTKYKFTTNMEWAKLEPCDPITVRGKKIRLTQRNDGINGIVEFEGAGYIPEIYTQVGVGSDASGYEEASLVALGPTVYEVMDLPPLRDEDYDRYIIYLAATGVLSGWPSAAILRSIDGQSYSTVGVISTASTMGYATTALGDWDGGNVVDEENSVTVFLYSVGTLSSVNFAEMLSGDFTFLLGNEIIFARSATLVSAGVYTITGMLRGRFGTEHYQGSHAANERFVLLRESSLRTYQPPTSDVNAERFYKGVTSGNKISAAIPQALTYAGNSVKPWTPVQIGGGTAGVDTAWTIKWMRRSRYFNDWIDETGIGDDESTFDFEVRIYDDPDTPTTVARTITVSDATASGGFFSTTYSNADQVTDFHQHQLRIAVSIRQIGSRKNSEWSDIVILDSGARVGSVFLVHPTGANGSTTFTDVYGKTLTPSGNIQIQDGAIRSDGTGDYISVSSSSDFATTTADMTAEFFVKPSASVSAFARILENVAFDSGTKGWLFRISSGSTKIGLQLSNLGGGGSVLESDSALSTTELTHVAFCRRNNVGYLFIGGQLQSTTLDLSSYSFASQEMRICADLTNTSSFYGDVKAIRITANYARYTVDFTPPTPPFTE